MSTRNSQMPRSKETLPEDPWEMDTGNSRGPNPNYYTGPLVFGMMQNPTMISDSSTTDFHPLSESWDWHQETGSLRFVELQIIVTGEQILLPFLI